MSYRSIRCAIVPAVCQEMAPAANAGRFPHIQNITNQIKEGWNGLIRRETFGGRHFDTEMSFVVFSHLSLLSNLVHKTTV